MYVGGSARRSATLWEPDGGAWRDSVRHTRAADVGAHHSEREEARARQRKGEGTRASSLHAAKHRVDSDSRRCGEADGDARGTAGRRTPAHGAAQGQRPARARIRGTRRSADGSSRRCGKVDWYTAAGRTAAHRATAGWTTPCVAAAKRMAERALHMCVGRLEGPWPQARRDPCLAAVRRR